MYDSEAATYIICKSEECGGILPLEFFTVIHEFLIGHVSYENLAYNLLVLIACIIVRQIVPQVDCVCYLNKKSRRWISMA